MLRRVMGLETEYGFSVLHPVHGAHAGAMDGLLHQVRADFPALPCLQGGGCYLGNGARFYIDAGAHPEYCTPEVEDPADVVAHAAAGDRILHQLTQAVRNRFDPPPNLLVFKANVDYGGNLTTWACHESYSHSASTSSLPGDLLPHLVSRILYTGAGGLNPFAPGIELCLSPRVPHIRHAVSDSSTSERGIYHTKNEPLAGAGLNRLHVLCGDSVQSHRALYLKLGATALVLTLAEAGIKPGASLRLQNPVQALQSINADPTLTATVRLVSGRPITALEIQRQLLELAETHAHHPAMPPWAANVRQLWRSTLDQLALGPDRTQRTLDWSIKLALYNDFIRQRGFDPAEVRLLNSELAQLEPDESKFLHGDGIPEIDLLHAELARLRHSRAAPAPAPPKRPPSPRLTPRQREFLQVREALCELEIRFAQLGPDGLFAAMDAAAHLEHALTEIPAERVERALHHPPPGGRAHVRGEFVREHSGEEGYACDWMWLMLPGERMIELSSPFADKAPSPKPAPRSLRLPRVFLRSNVQSFLDRVAIEHNRGAYEQAYHRLLNIPVLHAQLNGSNRVRYLELLAVIQARRGFADDALNLLMQLEAIQSESLEHILLALQVCRFHGLAPRFGRFEDWIRRGEARLAAGETAAPRLLLAFHAYKAYGLGRTGQLDEARSLLQSLLLEPSVWGDQPRRQSRILTDLAEVCRRLGDASRARDCVDEAGRIQMRHQCRGDYAEFTLLQRAKLDWDRPEAAAHLDNALVIQEGLQNRVGILKALLLRARLQHPSAIQPDALRARVVSLQSPLPAYQTCPVLRRILDHWPSWIRGESPDGEPDAFWGM